MQSKMQIITVCLIVAGSFGCGLFSGKTDEVVLAPTEVGTPAGDLVTKDIGPAGGSLSSPDGRFTLTVPQNAVTENAIFSVQPIKNTVNTGIGLAYRFGPNGKAFKTPLELTVQYDEHDIEGTIPEAFAVAFQDNDRSWHLIKPKSLDTASRTITVPITHFTDFSFLSRVRLSPSKATLRVGESMSIQIAGCEESDKSHGIRGFLRSTFCDDLNLDSKQWYADIGTLTERGNPAQYTAPPKKPTPNVATVGVPYDLIDWDEDGGRDFKRPNKRGMLTAKITIVDRGYLASGQAADLHFSGVICSLTEPFTVYGSITNYKFDFTPSSERTGRVVVSAAGMMVTAEGGGTYTIEGFDTGKLRIAVSGAVVGHSPVGTKTGVGTVYIDLTPISGDQCGGGN